MPQAKRQNWGNQHQVVPQLDLISLQVESYKDFLKVGILEALSEINGEKGIEDFTGKNWALKFGEYRLGESKYAPAQAKLKAVSYDMSLYVEATLLNK